MFVGVLGEVGYGKSRRMGEDQDGLAGVLAKGAKSRELVSIHKLRPNACQGYF